MRPVKISVVVPAALEEKFIEKCITSLRTQEYRPYEIIVSVNSMGDRTLEIAAALADKTVAHGGAIGAARARNEGARLSKGDVIVFLDADCQIAPNMFSHMVRILEESPAIGTALAEPDSYHPFALMYVAMKNFIHLTRYHRGAFGMLFCNREIFEELGGFTSDLRVGEIGEFIKRARYLGVPYKVITDARTTVSMRRLSSRGYLRTIYFWIRWQFTFDKNKKNKIAGEY